MGDIDERRMSLNLDYAKDMVNVGTDGYPDPGPPTQLDVLYEGGRIRDMIDLFSIHVGIPELSAKFPRDRPKLSIY